MAGPIRISILANAIQARREMRRTARDARNMGRSFSLVDKVGGRVKTQMKAVLGVVAKAGEILGTVASAGITLAPALAGVATAAAKVGRASLQAAPALLAIAAAGLFVKLTMQQIVPALVKSVEPITKAFTNAGTAAGQLASKGVKPLAAAFASVGMPIISKAMNRIAVSTNGVVKGFLNWAKSTPGLTALRNITSATAKAFEDVAPHVGRLARALLEMIGRIAGVSLAAGSKGLIKVLDLLTEKLKGINEKTVTEGLNKLKETFNKIKDAVEKVGGAVKAGIEFYKKYKTEILLLADVFAILAIAFGGPVTVIIAIVGLIIRHMDEVKAAVQRVKDAFKSPGGTEFLDKIKAAVDIVWPAVKAGFQQIRDAVIPVVQEIWDKIKKELIPAFGDFIKAVAPVVKFFIEQFVPIIVNAFKTVGGVISGAVTVISGIFNVLTGLLTGDWKKTWEGIKQVCRGAWKIITSIFKGALNGLKSALSGAMAVIKGIWSGALNFIKGIASSAWGAIKSGVSGMVSAVKGKFSDLRSAVADRISSLVSKVKGAASSIKNAFSGINLFAAGARIIQSLLDGITSRVGAVIGKIESIAGSIRDHFPFSPAKRGPLKRKPMKKAGQNIVRDLARGMNDQSRVVRVSSMLASVISGGASVSLAGGRHGQVATAPIIVNFNGVVGDPVAVGALIEKTVNKNRKLNGRPFLA